MASKDHLINSEHKEINHICLAYEMAEKGIKLLFFFFSAGKKFFWACLEGSKML